MVLNSVKRLPGQHLKGKKKCHSKPAFLYSDIATYSLSLSPENDALF